MHHSENEKSKVRAGILIAERKAAIAGAEAYALRNRIAKMEETQND